ncbi:hypothetical protein C817_01890 [Dorea sp. 5-2]|nr:hypothetical protein C817_01890 [Dorea sp. 5-2]
MTHFNNNEEEILKEKSHGEILEKKIKVKIIGYKKSMKKLRKMRKKFKELRDLEKEISELKKEL